MMESNAIKVFLCFTITLFETYDPLPTCLIKLPYLNTKILYLYELTIVGKVTTFNDYFLSCGTYI